MTNVVDGRAAAMKVIRLPDHWAIDKVGEEADILARQLDCCLGLEASQAEQC